MAGESFQIISQFFSHCIANIKVRTFFIFGKMRLLKKRTYVKWDNAVLNNNNTNISNENKIV
jgi:hypothetical protein